MRPGSQSRVAAREFWLRKGLYYKPGKADWLAHGLPAIRENRESESLRVMNHMQLELPTGRLDEPVGRAGMRAEQRGYSVCPVVNKNGVVLGMIGKRDWDADPTASAEQLMDSAPTTLRPSDPLEKTQQMLQKTRSRRCAVTDSDGKLLGAFFGASNNEEAGRKQQLPESEVSSR